MDGWGLACLGRKEPASADNRRWGSHVKAAGGKFDDGFDLFAVQTFEPFHNFVNVGAGFEILEDNGDGHTRAFENPGAAYLSRDAFHRRALRPIERCHGRILLSIILYQEPIRRGRTENRNAECPPFQKPKTKGWGARESSRGSICAPPAGIWNCKKAKER